MVDDEVLMLSKTVTVRVTVAVDSESDWMIAAAAATLAGFLLFGMKTSVTFWDWDPAGAEARGLSGIELALGVALALELKLVAVDVESAAPNELVAFCDGDEGTDDDGTSAAAALSPFSLAV